jgi:molecular chaperone Hsp33
VTISKHSAAKTTPYIGTTALKPGSGVAEGLAGYFLESEQTRTSFVLSIHFDRMGRALGAGGLYLQALPGASDEALDRLERLMFGLPPPGPFFAEGKTRDLFMTSAFSFFDLNLLGEANAEFFCGCLREKMKIFIGAMPRADLEDMAVKGPFPAEVTCHNCGSVYHFEKEELEAMLVAR